MLGQGEKLFSKDPFSDKPLAISLSKNLSFKTRDDPASLAQQLDTSPRSHKGLYGSPPSAPSLLNTSKWKYSLFKLTGHMFCRESQIILSTVYLALVWGFFCWVFFFKKTEKHLQNLKNNRGQYSHTLTFNKKNRLLSFLYSTLNQYLDFQHLAMELLIFCRSLQDNKYSIIKD